MWVYLAFGLLIVGVVAWIWRQDRERKRVERERDERRARTDELLARVLLGEDPAQGRRTATGRTSSLAKPVAPPIERLAKPGVDGRKEVDIDILLDDMPDSVAERARRQLGRPTNFATDAGDASTGSRSTTVASTSPISLQSGEIDVPLDALTVAWFEARGYEATPAPASARPITLLLSHRDDPDRKYAFYFDRGRLHAQKAATMLERARELGMNKLLVAAEHGADPAVSSTRLRDVLVVDWVALDREMKRIDFRIAAKIIAIARANRGMPSSE
jgi:hypothetical protein